MKFKPSEKELLDTNFVQSPVNKTKYLWYRTIKPYNNGPEKICYNLRSNKFRYSRFYYRIENMEELQTLIRILSKGK